MVGLSIFHVEAGEGVSLGSTTSVVVIDGVGSALGLLAIFIPTTTAAIAAITSTTMSQNYQTL